MLVCSGAGDQGNPVQKLGALASLVTFLNAAKTLTVMCFYVPVLMWSVVDDVKLECCVGVFVAVVKSSWLNDDNYDGMVRLRH